MSDAAESPSERFLGGAYGRIARVMAALTVVTGAVALFAVGWRFAAGFVFASAVAAFNYFGLKSAAAEFAEVAATGQGSGAGMVAKSLLRFVLLLAVAYVIFMSSDSKQMLYGFVAGLFVPIAAMFCEAGYEAWSALRHDI